MFKHPHCGGQHATAAEARACQGATTPATASVGAASTTAPSSDTFATTFGGKPTTPAPGTLSSKQQGFIARLTSERVVPSAGAHLEDIAAAKEGTLGRQQASSLIEFLMGLPKQPRTGQTGDNAAVSLPDVPEGHYAIPSLTGNNDLDFFRVDRPTEGKWAGYTFLKRVVGGKPDLPVARAQRRQVLEAIVAAGIDAARQQYGVSIGRCYVCNRHLTDELSRQLGIGPDCRKKG